jgi:anti-anti-sigma factor
MSESLSVRREGTVVVATLTGEVDLTRTRELRQGFLTAVENSDTAMVVDLTQVSYLDSAGVNVLFELAERLQGRQLAMAVVVPETGLVNRVVALVDLGSVAPVHRTTGDALAAVCGGDSAG